MKIKSKRKQNPKWDKYREKMSNKRMGKHNDGGIQWQYGLYNSPKATFNSEREVPEILMHEAAKDSTTWL